MARSIANVDITIDTMETLIAKQNTALDMLSKEVISANSTYSNTGGPADIRNSQLFGTFGANIVIATDYIRGGNLSSNASLTIISNVIANSALTVNGAGQFNANVTINATATFSNNVLVNGNTTTLSSNVITINGNIFNVNTAISIANTVSIKTDYVINVVSNTNIGSNAAAQTIFSFPKATYRSGKLMILAGNSGNNQMSEMIVVHDNTTAYLTVYGVVSSPPGGNTTSPLGTYTTSVNGANVEVYMNQVISNSSVKVIAHLIK